MNFNNNNNPFTKNKLSLSEDSLIVFVSDMFADEYIGGAELSTEALIETCPYKFNKVKSSEVTLDLLKEGLNKFWIFTNFSQLDYNLLPSIFTNLNYSVIEYDYKFCKYRSTERHKAAEGKECDCKDQINGKLVSAFFNNAKNVFFMSEKQMEFYNNVFPELKDITKQIVLSSIFNESFFNEILNLRSKNVVKNNKYIILNSPSWIKGTQEAIRYCIQNGLEYDLIGNVSYQEMLNKFNEYYGFVYLPVGKDTCPRMVIEAKLLDCKLITNENVQHAEEEWFTTDDTQEILEYLYSSREMFWNNVKNTMNYMPTISSYTTTYNCIKQEYPFEESIKSMLGFSNEVVVVDGGSTDGTYEKIREMSFSDERIKLYQSKLDWEHPRFAVFDGQQKAYARKLCTSEFCWQMDIDEVVLQKDWEKIITLCKNFPKDINLLALPVVEYWGSKDKVRLDITPWKWRLSRNVPNLTHGIPAHFRRFDEDGNMYAHIGTDGCDYITNSGELVEFLTFYTADLNNLRMEALQGNNEESLKKYNEIFQGIVNTLPSVRHYSWFDIKRKIHTYKNYWQKHWESLYNIKQEDTPENNMFFDLAWSDVTDEMIENLAKELSEKTGGHIFHTKVDLTNPIKHLTIKDD